MEKEKETTNLYETSIAMLGESTRNGYYRIRKKNIDEFKIPPKNIPSYYQLATLRPKIESLYLHHHYVEGWSSNDHGTAVSRLSDDINSVIVPHVNEIATPKVCLDFTEEVALFKTGHAGTIIEGAKVEGNYEKVIMTMAKKHARNDRKLVGDVICLDCFDGAEHTRSNKRRVSLISFSSQLFDKNTIGNGSSTSASFNI